MSTDLPPLLLCLALALLWFANTGVRVLTEPDEGRYAEIPREMLASGDWAVPRLDGVQYLEKPPLQYWATAAFYTVFGARAWVSRLWTSGLGFACVLLVGALGRRLYGREAGLLAALVLAAAPLFFGMGHINTLDMGLTFFLTAALGAFLVGAGAPGGSAAEYRAIGVAWLALALAMLQKGLVALVLPGFTVVLYCLIERDLGLWRRLHLLPGLLLVLALNVPWWWAVQRVNPEFLQFFFVHEHFTRFATTEHQRQEPWWYFSMVLVAGLLPWIVAVARGVPAGWRAGPDTAGATRAAGAAAPFRAGRFLVVWAGAVFAFFSPSGSKLAPYILPMLPPLALLAGRELAAPASRSRGPTLALAAALALAMLLARPLASELMAPGMKRDTYLAVGAWMSAAGAVLACATAAAAWAARRTARTGTPLVVLALGLVASFALLTCGTNALEAWRGGPYLAALIAPRLDPGTPFYCVGFYPQTLTFALARTCTTVGYHGELEIQFDAGGRHYLPTSGEFLDAWAHASRGIAVVDPAAWPDLQARGIPATILAREPTAVVISR